MVQYIRCMGVLKLSSTSTAVGVAGKFRLRAEARAENPAPPPQTLPVQAPNLPRAKPGCFSCSVLL
jgi:hypothetical protein